MQIDHDRALKALTSGYLTVRGKGGRWRDIELTDMGRRILEQVGGTTPRGQRCFIEDNRVTHLQIESVQRFIRYHRHTVEVDKKICQIRDADYLKTMAADGYKPNITYHGLRHAYARCLYNIPRQNYEVVVRYPDGIEVEVEYYSTMKEAQENP